MPRIIVSAEPVGANPPATVLDERIATADLSSDHFAAQLIERIGWALIDADAEQPVIVR